MGESKRRKQLDPTFGKIRHYRGKKLLPDFGEYLAEQGFYAAFQFQVFNQYSLGWDRELGYMLSGKTELYSFGEVSEKCPIPTSQTMFFSISLGAVDEKIAKDLSEKLRHEGLIVKLLPEKRYQTTRTREWVTPLQYLQVSSDDQR